MGETHEAVSEAVGHGGHPSGTWVVDPIHSTVAFTVRSMGIVEFWGWFEEFEGSLTFGDGGQVTARGSVHSASISSRSPARDKRLRSAEFLDADTYPEIRFEALASKLVSDQPAKLRGKLEMRGARELLGLKAVLSGAIRDPWDNDRLALSATGSLDRRQFGLNYDELIPGCIPAVSDVVRLRLDLGLVREDGN